MDDSQDQAAAAERYVSDVTGAGTTDPLVQTLGMEVLEAGGGASRVRMTVSDDVVNLHGVAHGGVIYALADQALGAAANSHGRVAVTMEMDVHFRAAASPGDVLTAVCTEASRGRRTASYRVRVTDGAGDVVALCQGLVYRQDRLYGEAQDR